MKWIAHLAVALTLAGVLIGGHQVFTARAAGACAPLICQLYDSWDVQYWLNGCFNPPCEIPG